MPKKQRKRIAAMFEGYRDMVIPADAGPVQVKECRQAFFAGATSLFTIMIASVEDGDDVTEGEMVTMEEIDAELREFGQQFDVQHLPPAGSA